MTSASALAEKFLGSDYRIKWRALGTALAGGAAFAAATGPVGFVLGAGRAIYALGTTFLATLEASIVDYYDEIGAEITALFRPEIDVGVFQLPYALFGVLLAFGAAAYIWQTWGAD